MAAAIGAGLPVSEPTGNMIVDIGGGTTEVAVISLGGIVVSQSIRVGGDEMDEAIMAHIKKEYKLLIGQQTAEELKLEIGSAWELSQEVSAEVRGRDMLTGLPKTVVISSEETRRALDEPVGQIIDAIKSTLDKTPPELAADIMDRGIVLAGGRRAAQRPRRPAPRRDADAGPARRVAAHVRRGRLRPEPRGVRGHPPLGEGAPAERPPPLGNEPLPGSRAPGDSLHWSVPCLGNAQHGFRCWTLPSGAVRALPRERDAPFRARLVAAVLVLVSLGLITVYFRESDEGPLHAAQRIGVSVLMPFEVAGERVARPFRDGWAWMSDLLDAKDENEELRAENEELRREADRAPDRAAREPRSRARSPTTSRGPTSRPTSSPVVARVIGRPPTPYQQEVIVSAGHERRHPRNAPVVTAGRASSASSPTSPTRPARITLHHRPVERRLGGRARERRGRRRQARRQRLVARPRPGREGRDRRGGQHRHHRRAGRRERFESLFPRGIPIGARRVRRPAGRRPVQADPGHAARRLRLALRGDRPVEKIPRAEQAAAAAGARREREPRQQEKTTRP